MGEEKKLSKPKNKNNLKKTKSIALEKRKNILKINNIEKLEIYRHFTKQKKKKKKEKKLEEKKKFMID